ncbi:menaquinone-dependent protoporphyrinogen IX dehydrogenase [Teredinibacter sp. KSP-S5-2]|uniref:menaquinone-dependent protoporphyrinogen IX dehydrogenase n=1 Tax=Teredinibacter sp. KSP-S5-2 TaxID=3034506 RepID=UPI002934E643|nr:menaquinone-dependent protoporphyrinogen IX dehydrogenase [Teredinibacter sp. KSP-S5-2]WNO09737.1 menaquinone-dependent protoporphyrinogen IX dehydrogenase [Teredinibacter sp. KSP-S5-2]
MGKYLLLYSTTDGQTKKICERIQLDLKRLGNYALCKPLTEASKQELKEHEKIIIGASIRYGKHNPSVYQFIDDNLALLEEKPSAFFSVNVVARKPEKNQPTTNPYVKKFFSEITWQPNLIGVFAGRLNYQRYSFWDRLIIRFIMVLTKGPTDPRTNVEYTDWNKVHDFTLKAHRL